ncbi:chondroitinase-B domain-containing protein [Proteiniphilum sp. UBA1028]|uniref:chondroitinase-B domain-containing protein n=1 Tax=Proteiniphilum sp. UBA1028 TaxID=1947251 RepID=UPI0025FEBB4C|nr:chondroitinase-B domain-containing protein [Proteiniphilum sp. UBA1028]
MKNKKIIFFFISFLTVFSACNKSKNYSSFDELSSALKNALPGDTFVIKNGVYKDIVFRAYAKGTAEKPIVVMAETAGQVRLEGESNLKIAGEYLEIHNLYFVNGFSPEGPVIEYRLDKEVANNCRITGLVIESYNPKDRSSSNSWVAFYGKNNRFDHNTLFGKQNAGTTLIVELDEDRNRENKHSIDHNFFGKRPNYGSNGSETMRVGNSTYSLASSQTQILDNWFEHCDGEVEHVSIKSSDNYIARNVFFESSGELVLRHGNGNVVEENFFLGNRKPNTGGIRIVGEDHIVRRNYLKDLTGKRFYAALAVMNAVPNSLINRYHQVKNTQIMENVFIDCDNIEFGVGKDNERTLPPTETIFSENIIINRNAMELFIENDDVSGINFSGNIFDIKNSTIKREGFEYQKLNEPDLTLPIERGDCGAQWFDNQVKDEGVISAKKYVVSDADTFREVVTEADDNDTIILKSSSDILLEEPIVIEKHLIIRAESTDDDKPIIRYIGSVSGNPMIQITDGGNLKLSGFIFNGRPAEGKSRAFAGIAPAKVMSGKYNATIENCDFIYFEESTFAGFKAQKNTFADSLIFNNCRFQNISGEGISLSAEKDDTGKYSAENVVIDNCHFEKILGSSVNIYRGGNDESTSGPSIYITNSTFTDSSNQERGSTLRLIGVQKARISNLIFNNSGRGGASILFDEFAWDDIQIENITYNHSGKVRMNRLYK